MRKTARVKVKRRATLAAALGAIAVLMLWPATGAAATSSWRAVRSPNAGSTLGDHLAADACATDTDCWAVGYVYPSPRGSPTQTLTEHYAGEEWRIIPSPNETDVTKATTENKLLGVACPSKTDCWAVGYYLQSTNVTGVREALIEHYDGSEWGIVPSSNVNSQTEGNELYAVTCVGETDCWAVGIQHPGGNQQPLIEHFDGSAWSVVNGIHQNATGLEPNLKGVTCTTASECWAVGNFGTTCPIPGEPIHPCIQSLIEHYEGSEWSIVTSPNAANPTNGGPEENILNGVSCASPVYCVAIGHTPFGGALIDQDGGSGWSVVRSPQQSNNGTDVLNGVSCSTAKFCVAVGYVGATEYRTEIDQNTGGVWTTVGSPNPETNNILRAVTCTSGCFAVGETEPGSGSAKTLIEQPAPEVGRCVKVATGTGIYSGAACIKLATTGLERKYEWKPASGSEEQAFSGAGNTTALKTNGRSMIKCAQTTIRGVWTGRSTANVTAELQGCRNESGAQCQSASTAPGTITTPPLASELGYIKKEKVAGKLRIVVGLDLKPTPPSTELASYECTGSSETSHVEGSVIGRIGPIDKMTTSSNVRYTATESGQQIPEAFQGDATDTLRTMFTSGSEVLGSATSSLKIREYVGHNAHPLEIKAT